MMWTILVLCAVEYTLARASVPLQGAIADSEVVFWGRVGPQFPDQYIATALFPIKGCLEPGTLVTVKTTCPVSADSVVLVTAKKLRSPGKGAKGIVVQVTDCTWHVLLASLSAEHKHKLATTPETCQEKGDKPFLRCPDGSMPLKCQPSVCDKAGWCDTAVRCEANACSACAPLFFDAENDRTCLDTCAGPSSSSTSPSLSIGKGTNKGTSVVGGGRAACIRDPCTRSSPASLVQAGCPEAEASRATECVVHRCAGCNAVWIDEFGSEVCKSVSPASRCVSSARLAVDWGDCKRNIGYSVDGNKCKRLKGCRGAPNSDLVMSKQLCQSICQCADLADLDLGRCKRKLGYAVVEGICKAVVGCKPAGLPVLHAIAPTLKACKQRCNLADPAPTTAPVITDDVWLSAHPELPIHQLSDGLQYRVISEGKGAGGTLADTVSIAYTLQSLNGSTFKTVDVSAPEVIAVADAQPEPFQQALPLMHLDAIWQIYIVGASGVDSVATLKLVGIAQGEDVPVLTCPGTVQARATDDAGAVVSYVLPLVEYADNSSDTSAQYTLFTTGPSSGSVFPIGATQIKFRLQNAAQSSIVHCTLTVRVDPPLTQNGHEQLSDWMMENRGKHGVHSLSKGVQYKVLRSARPEGRTATTADRILCHFRGALVDGTEFQNTYVTGAIYLDVEALVVGWQIGLQGMRVGDAWEIYIPSLLAFGPEGFAPIGPNEDLVMTMELLALEAL